MGVRFLLTWFLLAASAGIAEQRLVEPLNENWRALRVDSPDAEPAGPWQPVSLPHTFGGPPYAGAWYEKAFDAAPLPTSWRARLYFGGVKYNSRIWLNGKEVGGHFGGYEAFDLDATDALLPGRPNTLRVLCRDWTGVFSPGDKVNLPADWQAARDAPRDRVLAPIGGRYGDFGLWDGVELRYVPGVRVAGAAIHTVVRDGRLAVVVEVANDTVTPTDAIVAGEVLDAEGKSVLKLNAKTAHVAAGQTAAVELSAGANLRFWSPEDPYLHTLSVTLAATNTADTYRERFGWRQLWCDGAQFVLNGVPILLRASSSWPDARRTREEIADYWRRVKGANCIAFRTHTQPWRELWYEVADEVGILVIPEGAVWNDDCSYRLNDPEFWRNYRHHVESMIRTLGNHASVVMFSLENELYGTCQNERNPFATQQLADLVRHAKALAPTQPIMLESDGDPLGSVDVIGVHYPHELPGVYAYPDAAYWMDRPKRIGQQYGGMEGEGWLWQRDKPVYIGEYLWTPDSTPGVGTVFFGDGAYASPSTFHLLSKAESWKLQTQAYRHYRVSGLCPWTMLEGGPLDPGCNPLYVAQREAMAPLAAFPLELNTRFFAGERVIRRVRIFNDSFAGAKLSLRWTFAADGRVPQSGDVKADLPVYQVCEVQFSFATPATSTRRNAELVLELLRGEQVVHTQKLACSVWPKGPLPSAPTEAVLYDPRGDTAKLLGPTWRQVASLSELPPKAKLLIVGDGAFEPTADAVPVIGGERAESGLAAFVQRGGTVLVLAQEAYPAGALPADLTEHDPTICFATMPEHPVLSGLTSADLRYWSGDGEHGVATREPLRPVGGRPLIVSGGSEGLLTAGLIEYPAGPGTVLLCQLRLVEKVEREPAARQLLGNLIRYAAAPKPAPKSVRVLTAPPAVRKRLGQTRVLQAVGPAYPKTEILFASGALAPDEIAAVRRTLEAGGTVYLHRPSTEAAAAFVPKSLQLTLAPAKGPVSRASASPLALHVLREDLYWLDLRRSYSPLPAASDMIDTALVATPDRSTATVVPAVKLAPLGHIVELRGDHILCATVGEAETTYDFGAGGPRLIGGALGGSASAGGFPVVEVRIDGSACGSIPLVDGPFRDYAAHVQAPPGVHRVSLAFINDSNEGGQDRNLFIRDLTIQPAPETEGVDVLTTPAAVVSFPYAGAGPATTTGGPGDGRGRVLLDFLRWDDSAHAGVRGLRAFAGLLTGLGARFSVDGGSIVEGQSFIIKPPAQWNRVQGAELYLGQGGGGEAVVRVARAGSFLVDLVGWGTPAEDQYPVIRLLVNGQARGEAELRSDSSLSHRMAVIDLPKGDLTLRLEFVNDRQVGGEDRNAHIDRLVLRPQS